MAWPHRQHGYDAQRDRHDPCAPERLDVFRHARSVGCLLLDGVYRLTDGVPIFQPAPAPTTDQLQTILTRIITRLLKRLTRHGALIEEDPEMPYLTNPDADPALAPLHAAACTYRIALGPSGRTESADVERSRAAPGQSRDANPPGLCQCPRL